MYKDAVKQGLFLSVYQRSLYNVDNLTGKPWWNPNTTLYAPDIKVTTLNQLVSLTGSIWKFKCTQLHISTI